jgi:hypothetical protein
MGTLLIASPQDVGGVANLYPEIEVSSTTMHKDRGSCFLEPAH